MLDLVLGAVLVVLAIRGWMRGLIREVLSLSVLIVGTVVSFRLSTPLGRVFAAMSGASPDAARVVAGVFIFIGVSTVAAVAGRLLHIGIRVLPGVSTLNRAAGAALSLVGFALVVTLAVSTATVVELPQAWAEELDESTVADAVTEPDGVPQHVLGVLSGDRVVEISLRLREWTGKVRAVARLDRPIPVSAAPADDLTRLPEAEDAMFDLLNRDRVAHDARSVLRSQGLDQVAFEVAMEGYGSGSVVRHDDVMLRGLLNEAGIPSTSRTHLAVVAASPEAGHAALAEELGGDLTAPRYTKAGVAVVRGPLGLVIVEILAS